MGLENVEVAVEICDILAGAGVPADATDSQGRTALHLAASRGVAELLGPAAGANPAPVANARDSAGNTPLHTALHRHKYDLYEPLVRLGADASLADSHGMTAVERLHAERGGLDAAARDGDLAYARVLLETNDEPNLVNRRNDSVGLTPLIEATTAGHVDVVSYLLGEGGDIRVTDKRLCTALHAVTVAAANADAILALLLAAPNAGAVINWQNVVGETALYLAVHRKKASLVTALLEAGASPLLSDVRGYSPVHVAASSGQTALIAPLAAAGDDCVNNYGKKLDLTPERAQALDTVSGTGNKTRKRKAFGALRGAAAVPSVEVVEYVCGTVPNMPLALAIIGGHADTVRALLDAGADIDFTDYGILWFAFTRGHASVRLRVLVPGVCMLLLLVVLCVCVAQLLYTALQRLQQTVR